MQFAKLRLAGFKSFVDPTDLLIEPGMTGIVGPNGCGKSNLVEALQWVMGETSARRLRGGDMDDVIFGGTSSRPARNVAAVTLSVENDTPDKGDGSTKGNGTAESILLADQPEIEIERRIDRSKGSTYRVNGRETRARDVQLLFADAASGAQSTALVGQGRIGALINAKPTDRRHILEEAAGIGGLHQRRHEAELKLSAADTNLARLKDIAAALASQIGRLRGQAKQAERYRRLSDSIRKAEALALYRHWHDLVARGAAAAERLAEATAQVSIAADAAATAQHARDEAARLIGPARDAAATSGSAVERAASALGTLEQEGKRIAAALAQGRERAAQIEQDLRRELALAVEADGVAERLGEERRQLEAAQTDEVRDQQAAAERLRAAKARFVAAETATNQATAALARHEAERVALQRRIAAIEERRGRARRQLAEAVAKTNELDLLTVTPEALAAAAADVASAEAELAAARESVETADRLAAAAVAAERETVEPARAAERQALELGAEADALRRVLATGAADGYPPLIDALTVEPGFEAALGAALGDDLLASTDPAAPSHWATVERPVETDASLPTGAQPLARHVTAPALLGARLAQIGFVEDTAAGNALQAALRTGQRLVTRDGALWRWDGLAVAAGTPTAAAVRLGQRNRLAQLDTARLAAETTLAEATARRAAAQAATAGAAATARTCQETVRALTTRIGTVRTAETTLIQRAAAAAARHQSALDAGNRLTADLAEMDAQAAEATAEQAALPDPSADRAAAERHRADLVTARQHEAAAQGELDRLTRDAAARRARRASLDIEVKVWRDRGVAAATQRATLQQRGATVLEEIAQIQARPAEIERQREELTRVIAEARLAASEATGRLQAAEAAAVAAEQAYAAAVAILGGLREDRVRAEAAHEQAAELLAAHVTRIAERFEVVPEDLPAQTDISAEPPGDTAAALEARHDRLRREREAIGPVNLMAETEMAALETELATLNAETDDLVTAIARLRQGIAQLNREGRERLLKAFDIVNGHFAELYVRLYGGGKAHLELTDHEDPLEAGLEIMASPPGKKLQALSLLSGGERALTALALLFAVFLTNPAPVCVLDEVDAPLDDANVERFCQLVREIGERTGTRFLVITHHRVTMARMDRLYGVTMAEKGISQLVSVELGTADRLRQTA
ncbi:MAG TPA: chromosome segregation protein SMC [Stellaceae bacterium]|nr:chromosome segregation protein SMC [Stellaceae bacterium]